MARRPRRQEAVATALQRDVLRLLRRFAVALGRGAIDALLLGPLRRLICRVLRSVNARKGSVAARMAKKYWRDDPEPARDPLLRRAVSRVGGAIQAMVAPGRRGLAVVRNLLQNALGVGRYFCLQLRLFPGFRRRQLPPRPRPRPRQPQLQLQPPPQPPQRGAFARLYGGNDRRRRAPASSTPTPPPSPPRREPHYVDDIEVPQGVVDQYTFYCNLARTCPAKWTICHICVFDIQQSENFRVLSDLMIQHCRDYHVHEGPSVRCDETDCRVRVRPGRELALHKHFCH